MKNELSFRDVKDPHRTAVEFIWSDLDPDFPILLTLPYGERNISLDEARTAGKWLLAQAKRKGKRRGKA